MAAPPYTVKILHQDKVAPPSGSVSNTIIPLTFFDITWFFCCPMQRVFFYEFPCSALDFNNSIIPQLKTSLSLTLHHFFPFAANIHCPPSPQSPYILYTVGDAIQVTIAESDAVFGHFVSDRPRDLSQLRSLAPKLQSPTVSPTTSTVLPIMAIQFTLFPNSGISIGLTFCHVAADGRSFNHFMKSWASIHSSGFLQNLSLPYHNKDVVKDPNGISSHLLKDWWTWENFSPAENFPQDDLLVTVVIRRAVIEKLKNLITVQTRNDVRSERLHLSTFVVICAFMWVNLVKLQNESEKINNGDGEDDDLIYHFIFAADCRGRSDELQIPENYFGNCLASFFVPVKKRELMGNNGIVNAAKAIGSKVSKATEEPLKGAEKVLSRLKEILKAGRPVSVAGSPNLRVYDTDFGWGKPRKSEVIHIGAYGAFSFSDSKDKEGAVQIGLVIGRDKLSCFNELFEQGLINLQS